jgi:hypothetical protein
MRAAPAPFGKSSDAVFKSAWGSLMKVLPAVGTDTLMGLLAGHCNDQPDCLLIVFRCTQ